MINSNESAIILKNHDLIFRICFAVFPLIDCDLRCERCVVFGHVEDFTPRHVRLVAEMLLC